MAATNPRIFTIDDLMNLPDDGYEYELREGELVQMPPCSNESSEVGLTIAAALKVFVKQHSLGLVSGADGGYTLQRTRPTVLAPEAAFVSRDRVPPREKRRRYLELAPDLVAEVISPSDRAGEVHQKVMLWLSHGVRILWLVDPVKETVTVYRPDRGPILLHIGDVLDGDDVIPGFTLPVADIFPEE
jgi:Uma2 family endonuclease